MTAIVVITALQHPATTVAATFDPAARAAAIAPYVDEQTFAVGRLDITRIDVPAAIKQIVAMWQPSVLLNDDERERAIKRGEALRTELIQAGGDQMYAVASLATVSLEDPLRHTVFVVVPVRPDGNPRRIAALLFCGNAEGPINDKEGARPEYKKFRARGAFEICQPIGNAVFAGSRATLDYIRQLTPAPRSSLAKAFAAAGDTTAQLLLAPSEDQHRVIRETFPDLPEPFADLTGEAIANGIQWAALGVDLPPRPTARLVVQSQDEAAAETLRQIVEGKLASFQKLLQTAAQNPRLQSEPLQEMARLLDFLRPSRAGSQLKLSLDGQDGVLTKLPAAYALARQPTPFQQGVNHLKVLGLAMPAYNDVNERLPAAASYDGQGNKLLSWRVHILPYLDQRKLYEQFKLDEPWDSEHNRKLIAKMPAVYARPGTDLQQQGKTTYLFLVGPGTAFPGKEGPQYRDYKDGTSNTILVVDAALKSAVVWTKPDDLRVDPDDLQLGLMEAASDGFVSLFSDGSVHFLPGSIDADDLKHLIDPADGQVIKGKY